MIDAVVIEDEIDIQEFIISLVRNHCKGLQVVGAAASISKAIELIRKTKPEIVFLDVELKDGQAFEILQSFETNDFVTVLITGYSKYGIDAVKYGATDYLLKPIILKELVSSVERAKRKVRENQLLRKFHGPNDIDEIEEKILVQKIDRSKTILKYSEIVYMETEDGFTRAFLRDNQNYLLNNNLKSLCNRLPSFFVRIHRSYSVNLNFITSFELKRNGWVKLENGKVLPVSSRNKSKFLNASNVHL